LACEISFGICPSLSAISSPTVFVYYVLEVCKFVIVVKMLDVIYSELKPDSVVAWLSGNALVLISVDTLRWAQLILGWVTVCGQVNHLGM